MYQDLGHPYVQDYSVGKEFTWVLCMSPLMAQVLAKADFVEIDATFKASVKLENMINIVTFDYHTTQCEFYCLICSCRSAIYHFDFLL